MFIAISNLLSVVLIFVSFSSANYNLQWQYAKLVIMEDDCNDDVDFRAALSLLESKSFRLNLIDEIKNVLEDSYTGTETIYCWLMTAFAKGYENLAKFLICNNKNATIWVGDRVTTPLILASKNGHHGIVRWLLSDSDFIYDFQEGEIRESFWYALQAGYDLIVNHLLTLTDNDIDLANKDGVALTIAATMGYERIVDILIEKGANVNFTSSGGYSAIMQAAKKGHFNIVRKLVSCGANVNEKSTKSGWTPLMLAVEAGHLSIVGFLLKNGANVNDMRVNGGSALITAIALKRQGLAKILIEVGANVNAVKPSNKWTPLMIASKLGLDDLTKFLIKRKVNINAVSEDGQNALMLAAKAGCCNILSRLLDHGAKVDNFDSDGWTALMFACKKGSIECVKTLIQKGKADPHKQRPSGMTAFLTAVEYKHVNVAEFLLSNIPTINVNQPSHAGWSALMIATGNQDIPMLKMLIENGADRFASDYSNQITPLKVAFQTKNLEIIELVHHYLQ